MNVREEAQALVARGAALLDERAPGRLAGVDVSKMYLSSSQYCVLGMIFGSFVKGREALGLAPGDCAHYGFVDVLPGGVLGETWRILIAERNGIRYPR